MIALDTSILARLVLDDSPSEKQKAAEFLAANQCAVTWTVLVELSWVLERSAGLPRGEVLDSIWAIANMETVSVPDDLKLDWVLDRYENGADFADMVHLVAAQGASAEFATFDQKMKKQAGENSPLPVRTLRA
jgi:predicted nucleic-acid-binding protein